MPTDFVSLALYLYLLPGIAGYFVYASLAETKEKDTIDKIAIAITITLVSTMISGYLFGVPLVPEFTSTEINDDPGIVGVFVKKNLWITGGVALLLGAFLAWVRNQGWAYSLLGKVGVTKRTGLIDPWHQVFSKYQGRWVLVRFKSGARSLAGC